MSIISESAGIPGLVFQVSPFLIIPGIRNLPDDMFSWTDRAARHLRLEHGIDAEKLEYKIGAIRNPGQLDELADNLARVILYYNEKGIVPNIACHSNGNVVFCLARSKRPGIRIGTLFMLVPACWESCAENGLNQGLADGAIQSIRFFGSKDDSVVRWGGLTTNWVRKVPILRKRFRGYGRASFTGLTEIAPEVADRIEQVDVSPWGHSTFSEEATLPGFIDHEILPYAQYGG